jgi:fructoselysine-6-P-deglycase FrlB-like protein
MEYRHGPISIADAHALVWILGAPPDGLVCEVRAAGAAVEASGSDALVDLVRIQRMAVEPARSRELDPDRPRNLERSVILA